MLIINNKQPRMLGTCTGRKLMPGKNKLDDVSEEEALKIVNNDQFKGWLRIGWVSVASGGAATVAPTAEGEEATDEIAPLAEDALQKQTVEKAKAMIAACADEDLIEAWYGVEKRKTVRAALELRMAALTGMDPPAADLPDGVDEVFGEGTPEGK